MIYIKTLFYFFITLILFISSKVYAYGSYEGISLVDILITIILSFIIIVLGVSYYKYLVKDKRKKWYSNLEYHFSFKNLT